MIQVSAAFRQQLYEDNRNFMNRIDFKLADGTKFSVDNTQIWSNGVDIDDAISNDESFSALGSAVINSCDTVIYNNKELYSNYTFRDGVATVYTGLLLPDGTSEYIKKGVFNVGEPIYNDTTISLTMYDNMVKFDMPYSLSTLTYPASLEMIVHDCCSVCGVQLNTNSYNFPHKDYIVQEAPDPKNTTFRDVVGWCALIAGCFARCDVDGKLEFKWFNISAFEQLKVYDGGTFDPWTDSEVENTSGMGVVTDSTIYYGNDFSTVTSSGSHPGGGSSGSVAQNLNGGSFDPWTSGTVIDAGTFAEVKHIHYIESLNTQSISVDDVVITGVRVTYKVEEADEEGVDTQTILEGTTDYCIDVEETPFITEDTANTVLTWLAELLIGLKFRKCNVTHLCDPTIEAGDIGLLWDTHGVSHPILITRATFCPTRLQTIVCGAESPLANTSTRFSQQTRSYVELRQQVNKKTNEYDLAIEQLQEDVANASGLFETDVTDESGATIKILHDKRELENSDIQIRFSTVGIVVTANGTDENPVWYGLRVDGELIASIMYTIGINFDWGTGGTLTLGGYGNVNGLLRVVDTTGNEIGRWSKDGISVTGGTIRGPLIEGGTVRGSTIQVGGLDNILGHLYVYDTNGNQTIEIDSDSITFKNPTSSYPVVLGQLIDEGIEYSGYAGHTYLSVSPSGRASYNRVTPHLHVGGYYGGFLTVGNYGRGQDYYSKISTNRSRLLGDLLVGDMLCVGVDTWQTSSSPGWLYAVSAQIDRNLYVSGSKSRIVDTDNYNTRAMYCYETTSPIFGDIGDAVLDETGEAVVFIDPVFSETARTDIGYQVFLQKCREGDLWVQERKADYFLVKGTPNLSFSWEIKAKQTKYETDRAERFDPTDEIDLETTFRETVNDFDEEIFEYLESQEEILNETA